MEIFYIRKERIKKSVLGRCIDILKKGGVILYPTETSYAVGCDALNRQARVRIFEIKGRSKNKDFPLIAGSKAMVRRFCKVNAFSARLMNNYWPGPLTLVFDGRRGKQSVAIRVPGSSVARALSLGLGRPIVSTSANLSGKPTCYSVRAALRQLDGKGIDLVLDVGCLARRKPSTIIDARGKEIRIVRQGAVYLKRSPRM